MKHRHTIGQLAVITLLLLGLGISKPAFADDEESPSLFGAYLKKNIEISGSATMDYYSRYVWRGQYLNRDHVIQPGFSLATNGFNVGWWVNFDMENTNALTSDENNYYLS